MEHKSVALHGLKAGPDDGLGDGEFIVYPSTFTKTPDAYGDVVAKGSFLKTIDSWKHSGHSLPGLYGHRMDDPFMNVAWAVDMGEDEHGWWVKGKFDLENPTAKQVYRLVKGRRLNQLSFAYDVIDSAGVELENGQKATELRELKVYEFSFVPVGANQDTSVVAVKQAVDAVTGPVATKHVDRLIEARDALTSVIEASQEKTSAPSGGDEAKSVDEASVTAAANDEEPVTAKSEEPEQGTSVDSLAVLQAELQVLGMTEGN